MYIDDVRFEEVVSSLEIFSPPAPFRGGLFPDFGGADVASSEPLAVILSICELVLRSFFLFK